MSNSAKQRQFFNDALQKVRELGCDVIITQNKHFKAKISHNDKAGIWGVSTTPSNRFSAQRAAISDLKKILRSIGALSEDQNIGQGMLHMMTSIHKSSAEIALDSVIQNELITSPDLFKQLLTENYPDLSSENASALLSLFEKMLTCTSIDKFSSTSELREWAVLSPEAQSKVVCSRNVLVKASDKSNRYLFDMANSYKLKAAVENLLNYYQNCQHITQLGILLTNVWRPSELSLYASEIDAFESKGIQSVALIVSGSSLIPISWPWR